MMSVKRPPEDFYGLDEQRRIELTREAFAAGVPLLVRWANMPSDTYDRWSKRAALAAKFLDTAESVVDIGCGAMVLERYLKATQTYIPVDLAMRDSRTCVINLNNHDELDNLPSAAAAAVLGTLEYIYNFQQFLFSLRQYSLVVTSFNVRADDQAVNKREANGWVVHHSGEQLVSAFEDVSFQLVRREQIDFNEYLFFFS
jgi:hypothetical protein